MLTPAALRRSSNGTDITEGLQRLADHIANLPQKINYLERRQRFATWNLPQDDWRSLTRSLGRTLSSRLSDDLQHQCVSAYIWAQLTGSEWILAPAMSPHRTVSRTASNEPVLIQRLENRERRISPLVDAATHYTDQLLKTSAPQP